MKTASKWAQALRDEAARSQIATIREAQVDAMRHLAQMGQQLAETHNRNQEHTEANAIHNFVSMIGKEIYRVEKGKEG